MNFTNAPARGKPAAMKDMALAMHAIGGMSFCGIGKILDAGDVAVPDWVRNERKIFVTEGREAFTGSCPKNNSMPARI